MSPAHIDPAEYHALGHGGGSMEELGFPADKPEELRASDIAMTPSFQRHLFLWGAGGGIMTNRLRVWEAGEARGYMRTWLPQE